MHYIALAVRARSARFDGRDQSILLTAPHQRGALTIRPKILKRQVFGHLHYRAGEDWRFTRATLVRLQEEEITMVRILRSIAAGVAAAAFALSTPVQAQQKLKIGFITTLSGPPAIIGKHMKDSVEVALEHLGGKVGG